MMGAPTLAGAVAVCLLAAFLSAQQPATSQPTTLADEDEQMDDALRRLGYAAGHARQCQTDTGQKTKVERQALEIANGILQLFGSNRSFYFAAAFGAGAAEDVERQKCPELIKEYEAMVAKLKVLAAR